VSVEPRQRDDSCAGAPARLPLPAAALQRRIDWPCALTLVYVHLGAMLALLPWFFSWTGVIVFFAGVYFVGLLGINLCYHRLLTHRGFKCPKWFEHTLATLGVLCVQDTPARWVAVHRRHHQHADETPDPHSPLVNFFWGHMGWLLVEHRELNRYGIYERYAKDVLRDPYYVAIERNYLYYKIVLVSWAAYFLAGFLPMLVLGYPAMEAAQFGASLLVWGAFVRTVYVWHQTWAVNSLSHLWGYRNYITDEGSRNNVFVGFFSNGEGWHNNHHADPRSAKHGHRWWEVDITYLTIRLLARLGLVSHVMMPNPRLAAPPGRAALQTRQLADNLQPPA
jgi:stearoyl-CoA desaturase (delta-9 desaturase)